MRKHLEALCPRCGSCNVRVERTTTETARCRISCEEGRAELAELTDFQVGDGSWKWAECLICRWKDAYSKLVTDFPAGEGTP